MKSPVLVKDSVSASIYEFLECIFKAYTHSRIYAHTGQLRPSRELLEYYRQKLSEYDNEYGELLKKLDKYKCAYEQVVSQYCVIVA